MSADSPEAFTAAVHAALAALEGVTVTPLRALALQVEVGAQVGTLDLSSAWRDARRRPEAVDDIIAAAVAALPEAAGTDALLPGRVRPMLRTLDDLARLRTGRGTAAHPRTRPFAGELVLSLVHDAAGSVRVLSTLDADRLGLSDEGLWQLARNNLAALPLQVVGEPPVLQVLAGGTFDATCLWHPRLTAGLPAGAVAAAPARGVLLLCPRPTASGLAELAALSGEVHATRSHPLTPHGFTWTGSAWAPRPPATA